MEVTIWLVEVPMSTSSLDHLVGAGEHDFAALRLRPIEPLGCTTGRLAGFSPLSTRRDIGSHDVRVSSVRRKWRLVSYDNILVEVFWQFGVYVGRGVPLSDFAILATGVLWRASVLSSRRRLIFIGTSDASQQGMNGRS